MTIFACQFDCIGFSFVLLTQPSALPLDISSEKEM